MNTRGGVLHATDAVRADDRERPPTTRLPLVIHVLALGTFLMGTSEFVVAGLLPEMAGELRVTVAQAGLLITVFAVGMIVGAPLMAMLTLRLPRRLTLVLALGVFAVGHVIVALGTSFALLLAARFLTALATGAFWAVANVVAARIAGPAASSRALGVVGSGAMLANVVGVPLGAFAGQFAGWRGPFWALAVLAVASVGLIARHVPHDGPGQQVVSIRSELSALRSGRLWLALAACATTTGGVLSTYSYISPLLTDRAGIAAGLVPLVLVGFGAGALAGFLVGGRLGDVRPYATTIMAAASTTAVLLAVCLLSGFAVPTVVLVALLGLFGLGANPVLISLAVRFAGKAPTLGSALTVSAFNFGTAAGSWGAGLALGSTLGATGPAVVGTVIAALTLIPTTGIALTQRRRRRSTTAVF
ncbi:MFS transporter [Streptomyces violarus]|uniref:DHA1 family inner membrane transport protein n=1 Tax=Streptomyces violarus TaxID=67380 RepID=A0A7W4ZY95_9ACTN|nr:MULTISPECIES: MFS transporter [Streptomyces]MBB3080984.1 DHA1 family inner membrane transport protein [Streptomyces violarus]WRU02899.1 MFS transporter [Streptomyces sp. CGMCC 4.1772]GHD29049.1 MFS transporter [Streptomyces violarus]